MTDQERATKDAEALAFLERAAPIYRMCGSSEMVRFGVGSIVTSLVFDACVVRDDKGVAERPLPSDKTASAPTDEVMIESGEKLTIGFVSGKTIVIRCNGTAWVSSN